MIQISRSPSPSRGRAGTSHFSSKKNGYVPGGQTTFLVITLMAGRDGAGRGAAGRGGGELGRFEGGAQIALTVGIRSEVISHWAGTKLGVDVPALSREGDGERLI